MAFTHHQAPSPDPIGKPCSKLPLSPHGHNSGWAEIGLLGGITPALLSSGGARSHAEPAWCWTWAEQGRPLIAWGAAPL